MTHTRTCRAAGSGPADDTCICRPKTRWAVETAFVNDTWENVWTEDGKPVTFGTRRTAREALVDHLDSMKEAGMEFDPLDYRITKLEE